MAIDGVRLSVLTRIWVQLFLTETCGLIEPITSASTTVSNISCIRKLHPQCVMQFCRLCVLKACRMSSSTVPASLITMSYNE